MNRSRYYHPAASPELPDDGKQLELGAPLPSPSSLAARTLLGRKKSDRKDFGWGSSRQSSPSGIYKTRFPGATWLSSLPSQGVSPAKTAWCPKRRQPSDRAPLMSATPPSGEASDLDAGTCEGQRVEQVSTETRSCPAAGPQRGSDRYEGVQTCDRGESRANAPVVDDKIRLPCRRLSWVDDHCSDGRVDSSDRGLDVDRRQISAGLVNQETENVVREDDPRESIAAIRQRVRSLQAQEEERTCSAGRKDKDKKSLEAGNRAKPILGTSQVLTGHEGQVLSLVLHESTIFSAAADGTAKAWDAHTRRCLTTYKGHRKPVWGLQVTGQTLVTGSADGTVRFWDVMTAQLLHVMDLHLPVRDIAVVGNLLAVATSSADVDVIDLNGMKRRFTLTGHLMAVASLTALDGGDRLASGSHDTFIRVWITETGSCEAVLAGHSGTVGALSTILSFPPESGGGVTAQGRNESIVSGSGDATARVWGRSSREEGEQWACLAVLGGHRHGVWAVHGSPFSDIFVTGGGDASVQVWATAASDPRKIDRIPSKEEGEWQWECVGGVRGTVGAVGAVLLCEEALYIGTSEALIARFPLQP